MRKTNRASRFWGERRRAPGRRRTATRNALTNIARLPTPQARRPGLWRRCARVAASAALALLGSAAATPTYSEPVYEVDVTYDIVYGSGYVTSPDGVPGTKTLTLDAYVPVENEAPKRPAVVLIHGGAFTGGQPRDLAMIGTFLTERGFVCFSIAYRLHGDNPPAMPDAAFADARTAVRWVRAHAAEYRVDPGRIGVFGHSAGALTAMVLATCGPDDFMPDGPEIARFNSPDESSRVQAAVVFAGATFYLDEIDKDDAPLMLVHGTNDPILPPSRAETIRDKCSEVGIPCTLCLIPGGGHDPWFEEFEGKDIRQHIAEFCHKYLVETPARQEPPMPDAVEEQEHGTYTVQVAETARGTVLLAPPGGRYPKGTTVRAVAVPERGFGFISWGERLENPLSIQVEEDVLLSPAFELTTEGTSYTLDTSGSIHGTVQLEPPGGTYPAGTVVKLTPVPQKSYRYAYWFGDIRETAETAYVTMRGSRRVAAGFTVAPDARWVRFEAKAAPDGAVSVRPKIDGRVVEGETVMITAAPAPGARFAGWQGDAAGAENPLEIVVDAPKRIEAVFQRILTATPGALAVPERGGEQSLAIEATQGGWRASSFYARSWFEVGETDGAALVSCLANPTPYERIGIVRLASSDLRVSPLDVVVTQSGVAADEATATAATATGRAVYTGLPNETGLVRWSDPDSVMPYGILESNGDGSLTVGSFRGGAIGVLTTDGATPMVLPEGPDDVHIRAAWFLPEDPEALASPADAGQKMRTYFYLGIDSGAVDRHNMRFGVEWKDLGNGKEWAIVGQRFTDPVSAKEMNEGSAPHHVAFHIWKDQDGDRKFRPGCAAIFVRYALDFGPWHNLTFPDAWNPDGFPVEGVGFDNGDDFVTFRCRGLVSTCLYGLRVEGAAVPGVNVGLDSDGDGDPNETDLLPANPAYSSRTAMKDDDGNGLFDAWETAHFGASGQAAWGDPDEDGIPNYQEMMRGTAPL